MEGNAASACALAKSIMLSAPHLVDGNYQVEVATIGRPPSSWRDDARRQLLGRPSVAADRSRADKEVLQEQFKLDYAIHDFEWSMNELFAAGLRGHMGTAHNSLD